jgi:hypothetical protein
MPPALTRFLGLAVVLAVMASCGPPAPTPPSLAAFSVSPSTITGSVPTAVTWSFSFDNTPEPAPACVIDDLGPVSNGSQTTLTLNASTTFTLRCSNAAGESTRDVTVTVNPAVRPLLATFTAAPSAVVIGTPTMVTWAWTYSNTPNPAPACDIDNGVGTVASGTATSVTLFANRVYTITCTNAGGTASRQITVSAVTAPVAPNIATFVATPSSVNQGVTTTITWTWTYSSPPTPAPVCSIDQGIGTITNGSSTTVTIGADRTYTLSCTNTSGTRTRQVTVTVIPPVAPTIGTFTATPSSVTQGTTTSVTWAWTYSNSPFPAPTCTIDQGVGAVTSGSARNINIPADTTFTLTCTNSGGTGARQVTITASPPVAPVIASFTATPSAVRSGVSTFVQWSWTYANSPTPAPSCSISPSVGAVTNGQQVAVNITSPTTYTLTCTNGGGSGTAQATVGIAVTAVISGFTATPSSLDAGTAASVTWTWSYSNTPNPAPTCSIEHGVGAVTSGATSSVTLAQARTYQLQCVNTGGTATAETTVAVNDCASGAVCGAHATCVETASSYTCSCDPGYTGDGDTCSALASCNATPSLCDPNATCNNTGGGFACACRPGYVGDGTTCTRARVTFVTSVTGNGNLGSWADSGGQTGLAAADAVCQARAAAVGLSGTYVAWLSSTATDAYCRVHGLTGKKSARCGQPTLPVAAGPWVSVTATPFAPAIDRLLSPNLELYYPAGLDELGNALPVTTQIFTATDTNGVFVPLNTSYPTPCSDWTSGLNTGRSVAGLAYGGGTGWTRWGGTTTYLACDTANRLRCMEVGAGPALPPRHPAAKRAFVTSLTGNGNMSTWAGSGGSTGLLGADAICRQRARFSGYPNAQSFKAWMSTASGTVATRFTSNGPWARPDGVLIAVSKPDVLDGQILAPISMTELGQYLSGATTSDNAWTGTNPDGTLNTTWNCSSFATSSSSIFGATGLHDYIDNNWSYGAGTSCNALRRLYCFED